VIAHKFGGSSVADAERIGRVVDILLSRQEHQVVAISAMRGVTDALISLARQAAARDESWKSALEALERRHTDTARAALGTHAEPILQTLATEFNSLRELLQAQMRVGAVSNDLLDLVSGLGEVWSSMIVDAAVRARGEASRWLDAREVLVVEKTDLGAMVRWEESAERLRSHFGTPGERTIVTGFVARTHGGRITTLGRNGSDYSGAIFAALFGAKELHVWSDVEGVFSADPRVVPEAVLIERLSYAEACELAYFGASVIHPQTMGPAFDRGIPIIARSTFQPAHTGTRISMEPGPLQPVKGVTTFKGLAILNIEGNGMIGVPGTAARAFDALHRAGVSVVMISQGSSEHSICCTIREGDAQAAERAVREAFTRELAAGQISDVTVESGVAALAVVGDGMAGRPGTSAQLFDSLGRAGVNVRMIAQGASERNISVAIDAADAPRALRAVHAGFYLSGQTISVGVIGPGNVGGAFLRQLWNSQERLLERHRIDLRLRAVAGSRRMALSDGGLPPGDARAVLDRDLDLDAFTSHVHAAHLPHAIIVDCSSSDSVADRYPAWIRAGIHVVTPNKSAGSGSLFRYDAIRAGPGRFRYEATVGAGLPIITTLRDLVDTGDGIRSIEGIFSGTLAYLLNSYDGSVSFGELVRNARELGYTEPDPRDDLSGLDVARKLVILARERGLRTTLADVQLESLVPESMRGIPLERFLESLNALDAPMRTRLDAARSRGKVLRYVARVGGDGEASVGLVELPATHAFAHIQLTDNVVQFTTDRYCHNPLVVQGPGAGPEVTAAGVFADVLRVATALGAHL
jgi:aspartokinase/homoserine dehydrogenase 1